MLRLENDLSVAQQTVNCQDEGFRKAQHKVAKYRMEAQSFFESHQELAERFLRLSIRYDTHSLLLNKLVADLKALGKDVDDTEIIQLLADECDELRITKGEGSALYQKKAQYLDGLLKTRDVVQEMRTQERLAGAGSSESPE